MIKSRDKTYSKIEKNWFLLVYWVAKKPSKINERIQKRSRPEAFGKKST